MTSADLYELLEVSPHASQEVISAAWRRLARSAHPDAGGDPAHFKELEAAYARLSDPEKRASYDLERTRALEEAERASATSRVVQPEPAPAWTPPATNPVPAPVHRSVFSAWQTFEAYASGILAFSPRAVGIVVCAGGGFALSEGIVRTFRFPGPAGAWVAVSALTLLSALAGWLIGRAKSPVAWRRGVRGYALVLAALCAAGIVELVIGLLPILVIAALVVLWLRHRAHRRALS